MNLKTSASPLVSLSSSSLCQVRTVTKRRYWSYVHVAHYPAGQPNQSAQTEAFNIPRAAEGVKPVDSVP